MEKKQEFATQSRIVDSDVVVLGAGASGIAAAIAAARAGLRTILVDAGPMPGGELISGMASTARSTPAASGSWAASVATCSPSASASAATSVRSTTIA